MNSIPSRSSLHASSGRARPLALAALVLLAAIVLGAGLTFARLGAPTWTLVAKPAATAAATGGSGGATLLTGCDSAVVLFGPKTYVRANGAPVTVVDSFAQAGSNAPYRLVLVNGLPDGSHRVSSA